MNFLSENKYYFVRYIGKGPYGYVIEAGSKDRGNVAIKIIERGSGVSEDNFK